MFVIVSCELDKLCCCASSCCCSIYIPKCNLSRLGCYKCNERCGCWPQRRIIGYYIPRTPLKVESYHMRWIRFQGLESVLHYHTKKLVLLSGRVAGSTESTFLLCLTPTLVLYNENPGWTVCVRRSDWPSILLVSRNMSGIYITCCTCVTYIVCEHPPDPLAFISDGYVKCTLHIVDEKQL